MLLTAPSACPAVVDVSVRVCRDLNTNNVLVYCLEYDRLLVRVSDFGLSRELATGVQMTMTGFIGSPAYIAPEVLGQNARYDEKADVYSFGVLLWTLAQHLFLCSQRERRLNPDEHRFLLKPYGSTCVLDHCNVRRPALILMFVGVGGCCGRLGAHAGVEMCCGWYSAVPTPANVSILTSVSRFDGPVLGSRSHCAAQLPNGDVCVCVIAYVIATHSRIEFSRTDNEVPSIGY